MDLASSSGSSPIKLDEVDSSWMDSCLLNNGEASSLGVDGWDALKNILHEMADLKVFQDGDQKTSSAEHEICSDDNEIYQALLQVKGIRGLDDIHCDCIFAVPELEEVMYFAVGATARSMEPEEDIFKIWDLYTELEEGEIDRDLKKAIADSKPAVARDVFGIETTEKDVPIFIMNDQDKEDDLDLLISDMADLSLSNQVQ